MSKLPTKPKNEKASLEPPKSPAVRVGLLCKPGTQALTYQTFLQRKDFEVKLYHKLEVGIRGALVDQIRFLFVDLELPDPKVNQFIIAVGKVLPLYIIPFTNGPHGKLRSIQPHLKTPYCIFPPTTPSAIHRMIIRIQLEEERAKTVGEGDVFLKSSVLGSSTSDIITIEDRKKMEEKLMMVFKSESPIGEDLSGIEEAKTLKLNGSEEVEKNLEDGFINTDSSTNPTATPSLLTAESSVQESLNDSKELELESSKKSLEFGKDQQPFGKKNIEFNSQDGSVDGSDLSAKSEGRSQNGNLFGKLIDAEGLKISAISGGPKASNLQESEKTLITRATIEALQRTFGSKRAEVAGGGPISQVSQIFCFSINTQRFKGYMLYAHAGEGKGHRALLKLIREKLTQFLKENGETMADSESLMDLRVMEVDLEPWAFEKAEFLVKCADAEQEVAMAFVPREDVDAPLEESAKKEMLKLKIKELKANTRLDFDAYVFMPVNVKYVRYHKQGNVFSELQKTRLEQKEVSDLHIKKEAVSDIQKYRAVVFLDEKIAEYKSQVRNVAV